MSYETTDVTPDHLEELAERINELVIDDLGYDPDAVEIIASDVAVLVSADEEGREEPTKIPAPSDSHPSGEQ